jgi:hypothetical protein
MKEIQPMSPREQVTLRRWLARSERWRRSEPERRE